MVVETVFITQHTICVSNIYGIQFSSIIINVGSILFKPISQYNDECYCVSISIVKLL